MPATATRRGNIMVGGIVADFRTVNGLLRGLINLTIFYYKRETGTEVLQS